MRKFASRVMLFLLVTSVLALTFETRTAWAEGTIYINADGSITPATAPITTIDKITYTFTGNVNESIVVQRSNIVVDGAGYTVQGSGSGNGIDLESVSNVTVENANVNNFYSGIWLNASSNDMLAGNSLTGNSPYGVYLYASSNDTLIGNDVTGNYQGVVLDSSSNNTLQANNATEDPMIGIGLYSSSNNTLSGNDVIQSNALGGTGIYLYSSSYNTLSKNNATGSYWNIILDSSGGNVLFQNVFDKSIAINFAIDGSALSDFINWVDTSNLIDGKPVYYVVNQDGLAIDSSTYPSIGYLALVNCTSITVENISLTNDNQQGALLAYTSNSTITNSSIRNSESGIYLYSSSNDTVSENYVSGTQWGIYIDHSSSNTVSYNNVTGNGDGMLLSDDSNNTISCNNVTGNPGGIGFISSFNDTLSENTVAQSTSWGIMLSGSHNTLLNSNNLTQNYYQGIELFACFDDTVSGNNVTGNYGPGIYVDIGCFNETVVDNDVSRNSGNGITIWSTENNTTVGATNARWSILGSDMTVVDATGGNSWANSSVLRNEVTGNAEGGIALVLTSGNNVSGNDVVGNGQGFLIDHSSNNAIYHNNIVNNTEQTAILGSEPNGWDDGYPSGGNFWSDYQTKYSNATEVDSSGIWNMSYVIDANNTDHYPLMRPFCPSSFSVAKTVVGRGFALDMYFAGANYGNYPETFNVTVYANTTSVASENVTLTSTNSIVTLTWNTTGFAYGSYSLWAWAANDNYTGSTVVLTIPGDINGDGIVNKLDAVMLSNAFLSTPGNSNWNANADINGDGVVNILDAIILSNHFLQHYS